MAWKFEMHDINHIVTA